MRSSVGQELGSHAKAKAGRWRGGRPPAAAHWRCALAHMEGPASPHWDGAGAGAAAGAKVEKWTSEHRSEGTGSKALPPLCTHVSTVRAAFKLPNAQPGKRALGALRREVTSWMSLQVELEGGRGNVPSDFQLLPPAFSTPSQAGFPLPSPPDPPPLLYLLLAVPSAPPSSVYGTIAISVPGVSDLGCVYPSHLSP